MFRFADTKKNNGACVAAVACAEAFSSCANGMMGIIMMDAAAAASILLCLSICGLHIWALSILGILVFVHLPHLGKRERSY